MIAIPFCTLFNKILSISSIVLPTANFDNSNDDYKGTTIIYIKILFQSECCYSSFGVVCNLPGGYIWHRSLN